MLEQEDGEGCYETLSSGHGLAVEAMNSLKLWLPTEEQTNKITQHFSRQQELDLVSYKSKQKSRV